MPNNVLEEVELDFYGFTKRVTVNTKSETLYFPMPFNLYRPITEGYWVFKKISKDSYIFDGIVDQQFRSR